MQVVLNPAVAQQRFAALLPAALQWPSGTYAVAAMQVLTASEAGQPCQRG